MDINQGPCFYASIVILILSVLILFQKGVFGTFGFWKKEKYYNFGTYDQYLPNKNNFRNYYRIGYENSKSLGWKPTETWDHLRPEFSECPNCYPQNPIFSD